MRAIDDAILDQTLRRLGDSAARREAWRRAVREELLGHCLGVGGITIGRDDKGLSWSLSVNRGGPLHSVQVYLPEGMDSVGAESRALVVKSVLDRMRAGGHER